MRVVLSLRYRKYNNHGCNMAVLRANINAPLAGDVADSNVKKLLFSNYINSRPVVQGHYSDLIIVLSSQRGPDTSSESFPPTNHLFDKVDFSGRCTNPLQVLRFEQFLSISDLKNF